MLLRSLQMDDEFPFWDARKVIELVLRSTPLRSLCFRKNNNEFNQLHEYAFGHFLYQFHQIVLCISIYLTVSLALERYRAVWRPVEYHNRCKAYRDVWNGNS